MPFIVIVKKELILEQVRIMDEEECVKVVYPSKADLSMEGIAVVYWQFLNNLSTTFLF